MAGRNGISLGGLLIIIGLIVALVENLWLGILLVVIGALARRVRQRHLALAG
jgi:hypothetical protein